VLRRLVKFGCQSGQLIADLLGDFHLNFVTDVALIRFFVPLILNNQLRSELPPKKKVFPVRDLRTAAAQLEFFKVAVHDFSLFFLQSLELYGAVLRTSCLRRGNPDLDAADSEAQGHLASAVLPKHVV